MARDDVITILVLDDDLAALRLKERALGQAGFEVRVVGSGSGLLDACLPDLSGLEVCQRIKVDPDSHDPSLVSAVAIGPDDWAQALEERNRIISELVSNCAYAYRLAVDGTTVQFGTSRTFTRITELTPAEPDVQGCPSLLHPENRRLIEARLGR